MSVKSNMAKRIGTDIYKDNEEKFFPSGSSLKTLQSRLGVRGGANQWIRMRQDKLKSLKEALLYSYQSAIVQKYNVKKDGLASNILSIITMMQDNKQLSENQLSILDMLQQECICLASLQRGSASYIKQLNKLADALVDEEPYFRALINHDKLKVDYEDKIISIPFNECPEGSKEPIDTDFHNGTVFKWVHGNKEEWTPDTFWIVYMQYSEETAYFRAEIRKADEEIEIIVVDQEGNENTVSYRGWMTGPNETSILWNTKKGVVWNDMNYTKLLYITKDEDTLAYFQRFDRVIINGKPWEIQAYNDSYSTNKNGDTSSGIIRVALKETYTSTEEFVKEQQNAAAAQAQEEAAYDAIHTEPRLEGPTAAFQYDTLVYKAKNYQTVQDWTISDSSFVKVIEYSEDTLKIQVLKHGQLDINYGDDAIHVVIKAL